MTNNIIHLKETDSTNRYLRGMDVREGEMLTVVADYQTAGRGQGSNQWESEAGMNLLFSMLIRPENVPVKRQFLLSMAMALALKHALDNHVSDITLKWPNDIYWRDSKISGTLIETTVEQSRLKTCIFGTGINVNQRVFRSDAPNPVSLWQIKGTETNVNQLLGECLDAFVPYYNKVKNGCSRELSMLYHQALYRREGFYPYRDKDGMFEAEMVCVEDSGTLVLRDKQRKERRYAFKEVEFVITPREDTVVSQFLSTSPTF